MSYKPQPGTIPFRACMWIQAMAKIAPDKEHTAAEICEGLGIENHSFTAYMRPAREHGLVHCRRKPDSKMLLWKRGDGTPDPSLEMRYGDAPLHPELFTVDPFKPAAKPPVAPPVALPPVAPPPAPPEPPSAGFRAIEWDGHLLAAGMEIRDGVAIFTPEQVLQLKRQTDWWKAAA